MVHRFSSASGAGRTGLASLIELTAAGSIGDAFVTIALAGTLFFSASLNAARAHVALALLVTIAPYALLAPLIGPLLDRVRQGNRYILMGTLLARGLLCWGMAGAGPVTLLPAAFGVLVLQKVYTVTKAAVTPRLLPREITLVSANARANLGGLVASSVGAIVAVGIDAALGGGSGGAAWVLRVATFIYLAAMLLGLRLPDRVDPIEPTSTVPIADGPGAGTPATGAPAAGAPAAGAGVRRRGFKVPNLGPRVTEAMRTNAAIRVFYGFIITFLAFILRSQHIVAHHRVEVGYFGHISGKEALAALAIAVAAGGFLGTGIGSALRSRAPQAVIYGAFTLTTLVTIGCAMVFSLWTVLIVVLVAAVSQTLVKVALDSILQRQVSDQTRSSAFAFSETVHQLALVGGSLFGVLLSLTGSAYVGLTVGAVCLALTLCVLVLRRRRRILHSQLATPEPGR